MTNDTGNPQATFAIGALAAWIALPLAAAGAIFARTSRP